MPICLIYGKMLHCDTYHLERKLPATIFFNNAYADSFVRVFMYNLYIVFA